MNGTWDSPYLTSDGGLTPWNAFVIVPLYHKNTSNFGNVAAGARFPFSFPSARERARGA